MVKTRAVLDAPRPVPTSVTGSDPASNPVKLWALIGGVLLSLALYGWIRWLLDGDFQPAPKGTDEISDARLLSLQIFQIVSSVTALYIVWRFLLKSLVQERRLTFDGMIVISAFLIWYWDPFTNAYNMTMGYNGYLWNYESWIRYIPGIPFANVHHFPEPPALVSAYMWWLVASMLLGCAMMRQMAIRWPQTSLFARYSVIFGTFFFLDIVVEGLLIIRGLQLWNYVGVVHGLTIWAGHWYQLPIYQCVIAGLWAVMFTALRHHRDDRGLSLVERGVDKLQISPRGKMAVRFLAVTGAAQLIVFSFFGLWSVMAINANSSPADTPSYMLDGICGKGTDYACPSKHVPIPTSDSLHITPSDPRLPQNQGAR